ncbi:hypothetical protein F862_gp096 [Vibrio phage vB_VpaS_MAR10]|uniref:Uncharacterized protein n=1 Tax=Vibrio phage vB_VpaS_MAR10 TaxID=1229755 RepID=K7R9I1_9CAUD|nr:hypothetical protein F862_gp096 [Vibrio phage vB_VpaS_MAR10]AFV81328.1 hypothetical protein MAR10_093 [Vibrio phage vB_VpaS_MAR10]AXH68383.1 hypothetical protein [Vibrio phage R01]
MFNRKTQKQKIFSLAWDNARHAASFHGGKPCEYFAESLKLAYRGISLEPVRPHSQKVTPDLISAVISTVIAVAIILFSVWVAHPVAIISAVVGIAIGAAGYSDFELHFQAIAENKRINANTNFNRLITKF